MMNRFAVLTGCSLFAVFAAPSVAFNASKAMTREDESHD